MALAPSLAVDSFHTLRRKAKAPWEQAPKGLQITEPDRSPKLRDNALFHHRPRRKPPHSPSVFVRSLKVAHCLESRRSPAVLKLRTEHQASHHPYRLLCRWTTHLGGRPPEGRRYRQRKNGHSSGTGQGTERSICHALSKAIGSPTRLVASREAQAVALSG